MSTMFSRFTKFRSRSSSTPASPQRDYGNQNSKFSARNGKPPPSPQKPAYSKTSSPQVSRKPSPLRMSNHEHKPSVPVAPTYMEDEADMEDNVTFAESLFPLTPLNGVHVGRRSSGSFMSDDDFSPDAESRGPRKSPSFDVRTPESGRGSSGIVSKKSWSSQDMDGLKDLGISRRGSLELKKENVSKTSWDMSSQRSWITDGMERGPTKSWTSSSVPEEEIDIGPAVLPPHEDAEEDFLEEFEDYFNHLEIDNVRSEQYPNLDLQKLVYLDYASFSLYSQYQVEEYMKILLQEGPCLGSAYVSSTSDNPLLMHVRNTQDRLLRMLNTTPDHYCIVFTAGFQESFRVVAESYPFQRGSPLLVCQDNHAAVRPVIQSAYRAGGKPVLAPVTEKELCMPSHELHKLLRRQRNISNGGLFIYPAQSNLSGIKHSLGWVVEAQQNGWHVCVDATTLLPSGTMDLEIHQPDFVVGSFHHMVGYPSGMGFLLIRRESFCLQALPSAPIQLVRNRPADEGKDWHILCPADNTINLLQFAALNIGLKQLEYIGLPGIQKRVQSLTKWLVQRLRTLRHKDDDSRYLIRVYGSHAAKDRGSIVSFNVVDFTGMVLPPEIVRKLAARCNIKLSVGNFNNPGLSNILGGMPNERSNDVGIISGNWGFMAVRASLGPVSNFRDVYRLVQFLSRFRDEEYVSTEAMGFIEEKNYGFES